ncbi:MAG: type II toxin-antitoxin system RelE/ParE family toxin [Flavobacteriales bacterium]|nr:type II toxin-antitoxin system RelE/ParE family toxin [Flavobacteriales bacterium]
MKLIIKPFAEMDANEAALWYNDKFDGLGGEFLLSLDAKINAIQRNPKQFPLKHKNTRRALTDRFPYGIFYIIESETIYILAIIHTRRSPVIWKKRT